MNFFLTVGINLGVLVDDYYIEEKLILFTKKLICCHILFSYSLAVCFRGSTF